MPASTEPRTTKTTSRTWTLCETSPVAQIGVDRAGVIRAVNTAAADLLGSIADYLPGDPRTLVGEPVDALRFVNVVEAGDTEVHSVGDRTLQVSVVPQSSGHLVVLVDLTEHASQEQELSTLREFELDARGQLAAIAKAQAVIEFELDGTIIDANDNFLGAMGYRRDEVQGQHHRMFVEDELAASPAYAGFWNALRAGEYQAGEYKRLGKGGREVWIQATYNPIFDADGNPFKVVKYATDVTASVVSRADYAGQLDAISKSQAVIEFELDGTIIGANDNFLGALGYRLDEIRGQHHRMFVNAEDAASAEYQAFWNSLRAGEYQAGEFRRVTKSGNDIWIQASYNPILDPDGRPFKVVKYATDVTAAVEGRHRLERGITDMLAAVDQLVGSSSQLSSVSEEMGASAEESAAQANVVAAAAEEVSANVSTVASATEEMTASIREIASNSANAASVAGRAVEVAQDTNATAAKLGESSAEIGQIVKVITSIAQQTNLLALNATIEAARAGEVGKGFAVVANEVKELAKATARATEDISQKIETIQSDTGSVVGAIDDISEIIGQISDIQSTIASAVEEQAATTSEIGRNVTEAARGSSEIAENITSVAEAAASTSNGAAHTRGSAVELTAIADSLRTLISGLAG